MEKFSISVNAHYRTEIEVKADNVSEAIEKVYNMLDDEEIDFGIVNEYDVFPL